MSLIPFFTGALNAYNDRSRLEREARYEKERLAEENRQDFSKILAESYLEGKLQVDKDDPKQIELFKQYGLENLLGLQVQMAKAKTPKTVFGTGDNAVSFGWDYRDKKPSESAVLNLRDYNSSFSNPDFYRTKMDEFLASPAAAQQFVGTVNTQLMQYGQDFHFTNSYQDGELKTPVFTDYSIYGNVVKFKDDLASQLGIDNESRVQQTVTAAIKAATNGQGLKPNQILVPTRKGAGGFTAELRTLSEGEKGVKEKAFLEALAANRNYPNVSMMLFDANSYSYSTDSETIIYNLLNHTKDLYDAGAANMLERSDITVTENVADILYTNVSPEGNTARFVDALLPLVPQPPEFRAPGTVGKTVKGEQVLQSRGIDMKKIKDKNTFAIKSKDLAGIIRDNVGPNGTVKTGFAGLIQELVIGALGPGGQFEQLFSGLSADELESGTSAESLRNIAIETIKAENTSIKTANDIGITQLAAIQLAYARARAVDNNGRLSNDDFKIQMNSLVGTGLFTNTNVVAGKLNRVIMEAQRDIEDTQFYVDFEKKDVKAKQVKELLLYRNIIEPARKAHRRKIASGINVGSKQPPSEGLPANAIDLGGGFFRKPGNNTQVFDANGKDVSKEYVATQGQID